MKEQDNSNAKEKIISSALTLFADKGFHGTSIRDIAKNANVNLAAINYHFSNKQTLFSDVLKKGYISLNQKIENIPNQQNLPFDDLCVNILKILLKNSDAVFNSFKLILSHNLPIDCSFNFKDGYIGPPGSEVLLNKLNDLLGETVDQKDKIWATRCIFSQIVHITIMINSPYVKSLDASSSINTSYAKKSIKKLSIAILNNLADSSSKGNK